MTSGFGLSFGGEASTISTVSGFLRFLAFVVLADTVFPECRGSAEGPGSTTSGAVGSSLGLLGGGL
jgi:hypothetical protein